MLNAPYEFMTFFVCHHSCLRVLLQFTEVWSEHMCGECEILRSEKATESSTHISIHIHNILFSLLLFSVIRSFCVSHCPSSPQNDRFACETWFLLVVDNNNNKPLHFAHSKIAHSNVIFTWWNLKRCREWDRGKEENRAGEAGAELITITRTTSSTGL